MAITIIKFKDLKEKHQEKFKKEYEADPKNYDEELDENQMVMVDVEELKDIVKPELLKKTNLI